MPAAAEPTLRLDEAEPRPEDDPVPLQIVEEVPTPTASNNDLTYLPTVAATAPLPEPTKALPIDAGTTYTVQSGDTLYVIAQQFQVDLAALVALNELESDLIYPGQFLQIPATGITYERPASTPVPSTWQPSPINGDLWLAYPAIVTRERFTLHYNPNVPPADDAELLADWVDAALIHLEQILAIQLEGRFDVFVAGSLFAPPSQALRGRSFSVNRYYLFLHDGTGNETDQRYILAHELTHLFTWNTFGAPTSAMLSEGVAVYAGMHFIDGSQHLPIEQFCAAYHQAGQLPRISQWLPFEGHIRNLENYYAAGCFVSYLIETYGPALFGRVYSTLDFGGVYGKSLSILEAEWMLTLNEASVDLSIEPVKLILAVEQVKRAYGQIFSNFNGSAQQMEAYRQLDQARIALLEGRINGDE